MEIHPVEVPATRREPESRVEHDEGVRGDTNAERLAALPAQPNTAQMTAGNSSSLSDGASAILLAGAAGAEERGVEPLARVVASATHALDPRFMGISPAFAITKVLERARLAPKQIDVWEIHEAFAAQALGVLRELTIQPRSSGRLVSGSPSSATVLSTVRSRSRTCMRPEPPTSVRCRAARGEGGHSMSDYGHEVQFGVFFTPAAERASEFLELARLADEVGLDLVTVRDHPYQARFLDTWILLSTIAAQTTRVRVAPNVANLPLRPPVVLARSVASLDILSGGRVELGIGAGVFWDAIEAVGGSRLTPGESVDALAEAIEVIRAVWAAPGRSIRHEGDYYRVVGARPGPAPAHPVEIWLGAFKPRMLALTGAKADGWLPSMAYAAPEELPAMNAAIDDAAVAAGRRPQDIRRLYNISGTFGRGPGMLQGQPREWAEQLAELTFANGISTYLLSVDSYDEVRRFAEEVAPAVRQLVDATRSGRQLEAHAPRQHSTPTALAVTPSLDDGTRLSDEQPWDESDRPTVPPPETVRRYSPAEQASGQFLVDVHDQLRAELTRLRDLMADVGRGATNPAAVRSFFNRMAIRQNDWTLGAFCESYCRAVTVHHTVEDRSVFPHLQRADESLAAVLGRLAEEHEVIAEILDRIDASLVALVAAEPDGMARVRQTVDLLTDALLSHLSYEERELVEPLARLGYG